MKKKIKVNFYSESKKWPRRIPKVKSLTSIILKKIKNYFNKDLNYTINFILSAKSEVSKLNKKYKNKHGDTDVLTFMNNINDKNLGKIVYCDIFFSIDTIESFIKKNKINFYDHLNHLIIHSLLHINGYDHKNNKQYNIMKREEIKILKNIGIKDPYKNV